MQVNDVSTRAAQPAAAPVRQEEAKPRAEEVAAREPEPVQVAESDLGQNYDVKA